MATLGPVKKIEAACNTKLEDSLDYGSPGSLASSKGPKRRKNQQKRIVCVPVAASGRPTSEGLPSDLWAWRKYGQKPIKGSPFPRGYYRCSSSKGCSARKQVERSRTEPSMLIITYTAEHNHPWPSHRNALAGSSRMSSLDKGTLAQETANLKAEAGDAGEAGVSVAESPVNSMDHDTDTGVMDEPEPELELPEAHQAPGSPSTTTLELDGGEAQGADSSEPFTSMLSSHQHQHQHQRGDFEVAHHHQGNLHLTGRSGMSMQDDDFFSELGELPESLLMFGGRTGVMEDRSDDECGNLGMDNVDPYNLFCWSSGSHLESSSNVVM